MGTRTWVLWAGLVVALGSAGAADAQGRTGSVALLAGSPAVIRKTPPVVPVIQPPPPALRTLSVKGTAVAGATQIAARAGLFPASGHVYSVSGQIDVKAKVGIVTRTASMVLSGSLPPDGRTVPLTLSGAPSSTARCTATFAPNTSQLTLVITGLPTLNISTITVALK